nr:phage antirepressor KilAC domain-containing protein [Tissierella sp.]
MSELKVFRNEMFEVSIQMENGEVLFDAENVSRCLGFTTIAKSGNETIRWARVNGYLPENSPQVAKGDFIPESLVYKLAFKANNEVAERFQDWLAIEVIPEIRKNGSYSQAPKIDSSFLYQLAGQLEEKEKQIALMRPKEIFADALMTSNQSILIGELAKTIKKNGVDIGQNRLFDYLRDNGFIHKNGEQRNLPTQKSMDLKIMEVKTRTINNSDGSVRVTKTPKITGKGQIYFVNKFLENKETA